MSEIPDWGHSKFNRGTYPRKRLSPSISLVRIILRCTCNACYYARCFQGRASFIYLNLMSITSRGSNHRPNHEKTSHNNNTNADAQRTRSRTTLHLSTAQIGTHSSVSLTISGDAQFSPALIIHISVRFWVYIRGVRLSATGNYVVMHSLFEIAWGKAWNL